MFTEFCGCRRQGDGAVLVGDSGCGRHAFEWFDDRWRCSRCMVVRRGTGQAVRCRGPTAKHTAVTAGAAEKLGHVLCVARVTSDVGCGASVRTTVKRKRWSVCVRPMEGGVTDGAPVALKRGQHCFFTRLWWWAVKTVWVSVVS